MAAAMRGNCSSARATGTFSRAAPSPIPHFQLSQCAIDFTPHSAQPLRRSSSATSARNRALPAFRCPASVVMSATRSGVESIAKLRSMDRCLSLCFRTVP
jgi:hypothetical protein